MKRIIFIFSLLILFYIVSCKTDEAPTAPQNHLPKIESLTANPTTVLVSKETTLTCIATDEDGDNLTISWSSKRGTFSNGSVGIAVKWIAPSTAGQDTINVIINDSKQTIQGNLVIVVGTISVSPTLLTPSNNATEIALSPTLGWGAVNNALSYTLQVSASNSFSSFIYNQSGLINTSQLIGNLNHTSTYYWRVNATNIYGTSVWSNVFSFKTLAPPKAPTLLTPLTASQEISLTPTVSWDSLGNATSYTLQVSTNISFSSFIYNQSGLTTTNQQLSGLNYYSTYYWRVNATNIYGTSGWSNIWSFSTIGTAPQAPTLLTPINSATNISISPTLSWNGSNYATSYTLQVSDNSLFTNLVYDQSGLTTSSKVITGLSNSKTYYWRVKATNSYGTSAWSTPIWSFRTMLPSPVLSYPANGATEITLPTTISWNPVNNATSYDLQVSANNSFSSFAYNLSGLTNTSQQISGLSVPQIYHWRVNATDIYGTSNWSSYWVFTTTHTPCPGTPTITFGGKTYNTVQIGTQCWLKENLDIGTMIQDNQNPSNNGIIEKYCYDNDPNNCITYGGLYQWEEVMQYVITEGTQGICPTGWHIPTLAELQTLKTTVNNDGNALKALGEGTGDGIGTNTSGFSALMTGYRLIDPRFAGLGREIYFWSSTEYDALNGNVMNLGGLSNNESAIEIGGYWKQGGMCVRCIKD